MTLPSDGLAQAIVIVFSALLGFSVGSFINVVAYRLPLMLEREWREADEDGISETPASEPMSLSWPPSHCPSCQTPLRFWQNVPVLSFLMLRGRCHSCGTPISWRYPLVEALGGLAFLALALGSSSGVTLAFSMAFTAALLTLAAIDSRALILPDVIVQPLLWLGLLANLNGRFAPLPDAVIGAVAGYMSLWIVSRLYSVIRNRDGMGDGDMKLLAALGAWLGWQMVTPILLLAAVSALVVTLIAVLSGRRSANDALPFGPFLALAGWVCLAHVMRLV